MAYYSLEPWGPERADLNSGIIASVLANVHRDPKSGKTFAPADFMPRYGQEPEPEPEPEEDGMTPHKLTAIMDGIMERQNRRVELREKISQDRVR